MRSFYGVIGLLVLLTACLPMGLHEESQRDPSQRSTFAKFLKLAEAGDAKGQNRVGFMHYFGEGAPKDRYLAHRWFHRAADNGNVNAQLNLSIMHYLGAGVPQDLDEAQHYFRLAKDNNSLNNDSAPRLQIPESLAELEERAAMRPWNSDLPGESTYATFCAGCHGLNGVAAYVGAPSFALAERMEKSDAELFRTMTRGHGVMPTWQDRITEQALVDALQFVRTLPAQYQNGIAQVLRTPPSLFFFFGPMSADPTGFYRDDTY